MEVVGGFLLALSLVTLFCIPAVAMMQILSGLLFGPLLGTFLSVVAQTLGGVLAFLVARSTFRQSFARLIGRYLGGLEAGFKANAFTYIVALRMTPIMPYWVVNIAPGLLGVSLWPFTLGTLVGAIPLTFVYAAFGTGLAEVIEAGGQPELADLLTPRAALLILLALLFALAPLLMRRWFGRKVNLSRPGKLMAKQRDDRSASYSKLPACRLPPLADARSSAGGNHGTDGDKLKAPLFQVRQPFRQQIQGFSVGCPMAIAKPRRANASVVSNRRRTRDGDFVVEKDVSRRYGNAQFLPLPHPASYQPFGNQERGDRADAARKEQSALPRRRW